MLLQLENTDEATLRKLMEYAQQLNLKLSLIEDFDELEDDPALPGEPYTQKELQNFVEESLNSGVVEMKEAFKAIHKDLYGD